MATIFRNDESGALSASNARDIESIEFECPYQSSPRACGSWCALFEIASSTRGTDGATMSHIRLNCGAGTGTFAAKENVGDTDGQMPFQEYPGQS
jgi:hypothetical protein